MADDHFSFSLVSSVSDVETIHTPRTGQQIDDFDLLLEHSEYVDEEGRLVDCASDCSTSLPPSIYQHEYDHGRRYHSYKSGRYPMPNDSLEQELEELRHHLILELTVRLLSPSYGSTSLVGTDDAIAGGTSFSLGYR